MAKKYLYHGRLMFVAKDGDKRFCSFWKDSEEELHRVILRELPVRKAQATAQKDLDRWAAEKKLPVRGDE